MNFVTNHKKLSAFIAIIVFLVIVMPKDEKKKENENIKKTVQASSTNVQQPVKIIRATPSPQGSRVLGMSISEGGIGFDKAFSLAHNVGVRVIELPVAWDEYEVGEGKYSANWLPVADGFYPKNETRIALSLNPIDTTNVRLPKDLKGKSFNDPVVIKRYKAFVDFVSQQVSHSDIFFVAIGNEIDVYLGDSDKKWQEYNDFYNAVAPYVREKFPHAVIGSKVTFEGIVKHDAEVRKIENSSDVVLVTYYPFKQGQFIVREPDTVINDFKHITELYPDKKIYFTEIGYPSGELNGSSEEKQAQFIQNSFSAWDTYAVKIPFLNFVWLHDKSKEDVKEMQRYYGFSDKAFASYLGTIGLRTYEGEDKQAFIEFRKATKERGW